MRKLSYEISKKGHPKRQLELYVADVFSVGLAGTTFPSPSFSSSSWRKREIPSLSYPILSACLRQALLFARQKYDSRNVKITLIRKNAEKMPKKRVVIISTLSKYEQETVINFNAGEHKREQMARYNSRDSQLRKCMFCDIIALLQGERKFEVCGRDDIVDL